MPQHRVRVPEFARKRNSRPIVTTMDCVDNGAGLAAGDEQERCDACVDTRIRARAGMGGRSVETV
jgi:hypothetical protein